MNITEVPINLQVTVAQVNVILAGLGKLPYDDVHELIVGIKHVALTQLQARQQEQEKPEEQKAADAPQGS